MTPGFSSSRPVYASGPMFNSNQDEYIQQIREQGAAWDRVGCALAGFLRAAFPQADAEACELGNAISSLMKTGDERQIARLSQPPPSFPMYGPNPTAVLARLVEDRDRLQSQIDQALSGVETLRKDSDMGGMGDIFEAGVIGPLRGMLADIEGQISRVQESMEEGLAESGEGTDRPE